MSDHPLAFGQHPNADIQSAIQDTQDLLSTVISLQPRVVSAGGETNENKVLVIAAELERTLPESFDEEEASAHTYTHTHTHTHTHTPLVFSSRVPIFAMCRVAHRGMYF